MGWNPFRRKEPDNVVRQSALRYASYQAESAKGRLAYTSGSSIAIMTADGRRGARVADLLAPMAEAYGYSVRPTATVNEALNSRVVLFDTDPWSDSRMHADYDRVLRIKKSMKKLGHDFLGAFGPRRLARNYSRGTYGTLHYFCYEGENSNGREEDIPPAGKPTVEGPILYNFADMPAVIETFLKSA